MQRGTMVDREYKIFAGVQGAVFIKRAPWLPGAKNKFFLTDGVDYIKIS